MFTLRESIHWILIILIFLVVVAQDATINYQKTIIASIKNLEPIITEPKYITEKQFQAYLIQQQKINRYSVINIKLLEKHTHGRSKDKPHFEKDN